jgi:hypothetical protein
MAASVLSLSIDSRAQRSRLAESELDDELPGVLPSKIDCFGRALPKVAFTATLRHKLRISTVRAALARWRQPEF